MRFHTRHSSASYLGKRSQSRLLRMLLMLIVVMIGIRVAGRASFWAWMFPDANQGAASQPAEEHKAPPPIDFDVQLDEGAQLRPGEFIAAPQEAALPASAGDDPAGDPSLEFDPELLAPVRDNTLNVRRDELEAYYTLLARARDLPAGTLEKRGDPDVSFSVLMTQSSQFRGKPITVRGEIRRLLPFAAGKNDHEITDLWEAWLFTEESGLNPYRIVCVEVPPGIPRGEELKDAVPARVSGFFFKKEGYSARGGLHTAPLILARTIRWLPPPPVSDKPDSIAGPWIVVVVCLTAAVLALTCWRISSGDRASHTRNFHRFYEPRPESLEALQGLETTDESDLFSHLAEGNGEAEAAERPAPQQRG